MTLRELNALDWDAFVDALGWIFERSPWVAERTWRRKPFSSIDQLHAAMVAEVAGAGAEEQLVLLRAHPDLGARADMTEVSADEQAGAGLGALAPAESARLQELNTAYREKFGFPFLYAVKGRTKLDILKALEARMPAGREEELDEALHQVSRIARFRLEDLLS